MKIRSLLSVCCLCVGMYLTGCSEQENPKDSYTITGDRYDFIVLGDNRPDVEHFERFLRGASHLDVDQLVHVGDMIDFSSAVGFLSIEDALDKYLRSGISFVPVIGNHDMDGAGGNSMASLKLFLDVFDLPKNSLGYRKMEFSNYAFIVLNSHFPNQENSIGTTQMAWLDTTLSELQGNSPSKSVFVFMHHPAYPAGQHVPLENSAELNTLLMKYPAVRAVFSGHEHLYYHEEVTSGSRTIDYYVTGGAGSQLHHVPKGKAVFHMLGVRVSPNFTVSVLDENGDVIDL